jgi:hypothetical protein
VKQPDPNKNGGLHMSTAKIFNDFLKNKNKSILPDFSYAGYQYGEKEIPSPATAFSIADYGVVPDTEVDMTAAIQKAIDDVGSKGGGVLLFPKGRYAINTDPENPDYLRVNYSNIVLRGEGSGNDGSVLCSYNRLLLDNKPWLSPGIIHTGEHLWGNTAFMTPDDLTLVSRITLSASKGDKLISLQDTSKLKAGDVILLCMKNTDDEGTLIHKLLSPHDIDESWENAYLAGRNRHASYQWLVEVDTVVNSEQILLKQPLRIDIETKFDPFVCQLDMLRNVGIENMRISSTWDGGGYTHHKNKEVDYGWTGIVMHRVSHGWVKDVVIEHLTQGIQLRNSRNVTVKDCEIVGHPGHYGLKCYSMACDNLLEDIRIDNHRTHGLGLEGLTQGNVYRNIVLEGEGTDIDFHGGGIPSYNLIENVTNVGKIQGGGSRYNFPQCAHYNTFWNNAYLHSRHRRTNFREDRLDELFQSWYWNKINRPENDDHHMYTRSIVVGVYSVHPDKQVKIGGLTVDRHDEWIYVEGLNQMDVEPKSLYQAQLEIRLHEVRA